MEQNRTTIYYPAMEIVEIAAESLITKLNNQHTDNLTAII
jgi:hypothetical protein